MPPKKSGKAKAKAVSKTASNSASASSAEIAKPDKAEKTCVNQAFSIPKKCQIVAIQGVASSSCEPLTKLAKDKANDITPAEYKAAVRLLSKKICFAEAELDDIVNSKGDSIVKWVVEKTRSLKGSGSYLSTDKPFWTLTLKEFGLDPDPFADLPEPKDQDDDDALYDNQLQSVVRKVIGDNPADKYPALKLLEKRLSDGPPLPCFQMYALLLASCEGEDLTRNLSFRMQFAILRMLCGHDKYLNEWKEAFPFLHERMILVGNYHWQKNSVSITRDSYLTKNRRIAEYLCGKEAFNAVHSALKEKRPIPIPELNIVLSNAFGRSLFKQERMEIQWTEFERLASSHLSNVLHADWNEIEYETFKTNMRKATYQLIQSGHTVLKKDTYETCWLGIFKMPLVVRDIDDFWAFPTYTTLCNCLLNSGAAEKMPWETHLLGDSEIAGFPATQQIPEQVAMDIVECRRNMKIHLEGKTTIQSWQATVQLHKENMIEMNKNWVVDATFALDYLDDAMQKAWRKDLLKCFDRDEKDVASGEELNYAKECLAKAKKMVLQLRQTPLCVALADVADDDIKWVLSWLTDVSEHNVKKELDMKDWAPYKRAIVSGTEDFVKTHSSVVENPNGETGIKAILKKSIPKILYGKEALFTLFDDLKRKHHVKAEGGAPTLAKLEIFRKFRWCLSADDQKQLEAFIQAGSQARMKILGNSLVDKDMNSSAKDDSTGSKSDDVVSQVAVYTAIGAESVASKKSSRKRDISFDEPTRREKVLKLLGPKGKAF